MTRTGVVPLSGNGLVTRRKIGRDSTFQCGNRGSRGALARGVTCHPVTAGAPAPSRGEHARWYPLLVDPLIQARIEVGIAALVSRNRAMRTLKILRQIRVFQLDYVTAGVTAVIGKFTTVRADVHGESRLTASHSNVRVPSDVRFPFASLGEGG